MNRALAILLIASLAALQSLAADVVFGSPSSIVWAPAGGNNVVATWPAGSVGWTPTWAIRMNATNLSQYTDSGLYVQQGWAVKMLVNIRSNPATTRYTGSAFAGGYYLLGGSAAHVWQLYYGDTLNQGGNESTGWHYISIVSTNLHAYLYTNGVLIITRNAASFSTNTTKTFYVGWNLAGGNGEPWDVARIQLIRWDGVLQRDLIATGSGTFTNAIDGATFTFGAGVGGTGGTSADSTNVSGQIFPAQTWK